MVIFLVHCELICLLSGPLPSRYLPSCVIGTHSNAVMVLKLKKKGIKMELSRSPLDRWNEQSD